MEMTKATGTMFWKRTRAELFYVVSHFRVGGFARTQIQ